MNQEQPILTESPTPIATSSSDPGAGIVYPPVASTPPTPPEPAETRFLKWVIFGPAGVRVGWSVALFLVLTVLCMGILGVGLSLFVKNVLHQKFGGFTAVSSIVQEAVQCIGILIAALVSAKIERRRIRDYNLAGPSRGLHFLVGFLAGFVALSALVGSLHYGGWLKFGAIALTGPAILQFGLLWGIGFLLTGFAEEGITRCYMQYTLTRGINYWWALGTVSVMSLFCVALVHNQGARGVYIMTALGLVPCLLLQLRKSPAAGFWNAAWVTSTFFGFIHTGNDGETWIGIFSAAAIGFIFCVSVRLTGSAWWAIGFHASWDWAQTFFYGTADSGFQPKGHYLTTTPAGPVFWSGGTDGPEGSVLVLAIILLTLIGLVVAYGRKSKSESPSPAALPQLS